jgi:hypothetical protein
MNASNLSWISFSRSAMKISNANLDDVDVNSKNHHRMKTRLLILISIHSCFFRQSTIDDDLHMAFPFPHSSKSSSRLRTVFSWPSIHSSIYKKCFQILFYIPIIAQEWNIIASLATFRETHPHKILRFPVLLSSSLSYQFAALLWLFSRRHIYFIFSWWYPLFCLIASEDRDVPSCSPFPMTHFQIPASIQPILCPLCDYYYLTSNSERPAFVNHLPPKSAISYN